ncbi:uncharacterized protein [Paralichthys olivaceus]|uniref:uncharacterized protein n=1 Tax=Paralichthys olivaceus TaxID=8255 RepID=UPI003752BFDD
MDVESLQKSGHRRSSRLNAFLVVSVIFLFVAVAAVAAGGVMVVIDLRSKLKPLSFDFETVKLTGHAPYPESKMNKFAYLRFKSGQFENTTAMPWTPVHYGKRMTVGSNFLFEQDSLTLKQVGIYFMYIELNFTCTFRCKATVLSVRVGDALTCKVQLPDVAHKEQVYRKCWTLTQLEEQSLQTQMTVPEDGLPLWKLEQNGSGLGIFVVD